MVRDVALSSAPGSPAALFLHCSWRCAGTWLWSLYRAHPRVTGFYEPLNESLASVAAPILHQLRPAAWDSGHPDAERPYFEEYAPLLSATIRGAAGYRVRFAYEEYFSAPDAELPELAAYLRTLVELARERTTFAALKFCRSSGRVGWMRRTFPDAAHVVVLRNPWSQWLSGLRSYLDHENPYFVAVPFVVLTLHPEHPQLAAARDALKVRLAPLNAAGLEARYRACCAAVRVVPRAVLYRAFLALWLASAAEAIAHADAVVDSDHLCASPAYRAFAERDLARLTGIPVSLAGVRGGSGALVGALSPEDREAAHGDALDACRALAGGTAVAAALAAKLCEASRLASPATV